MKTTAAERVGEVLAGFVSIGAFCYLIAQIARGIAQVNGWIQ
jgi:hypothetical protein